MAEDWTPKDNWSPNNHNHDSAYAAKSHNHDSAYSKLSHLHDDRYSQTSHNHDSVYSKLGHVHDYAASNHNHDGTYSKLGHNHDDRYITKITSVYIIDSGRDNAGNWYRKWSDGTLEQGGIVATPNITVGEATISFELQFANTNYQVLFTCGGSISETGTRYDHYVKSKTVNDCIVEDHMLRLQCDWIEWMAIGTYAS
jgi:hypothetical protein